MRRKNRQTTFQLGKWMLAAVVQAGLAAGTAVGQAGPDQAPPPRAVPEAGFPIEVGPLPAGPHHHDGAPGRPVTCRKVSVPLRGTLHFRMCPPARIKYVTNDIDLLARVYNHPEDPTTLLIQGLAPGVTHLTVTGDNGACEEVDVLIGVADLEHLIRCAVPTSRVKVMAGRNNVLILTGEVDQAEDIETIMRLAASYASAGMTIGQARTGGGGGATGVDQGTTGGAVAGGGQGIVGGTTSAGGGQGATATTNIVNAMKVGGVQQVQLDVVVARVARSELRGMRFDFLNLGSQHAIASTVGSGFSVPVQGISGFFPGGPTITNQTTPGNIFMSVFTPVQDFYSIMDALRTEGLAKLLAEPRLVTLTCKAAIFNSGGQQAVPTVSGFGGTAGVDFVPFGTQLNFLPMVLGNGKIYLEVDTAITTLNPAFGTPLPGTNGIVPGRDEQRVHTSVVMESEQTFVIGGLVQHRTEGSLLKLPLLGDLPFIGTAFSRKNFEDREEELIIMVTPHLVDPMDCSQVAKRLPGMETRNPDDFELFLEGILEAPRGPRKVYPDGRRYAASWMKDPTRKLYPCAGKHCPGSPAYNGHAEPGCSNAGCVGGCLPEPGHSAVPAYDGHDGYGPPPAHDVPAGNYGPEAAYDVPGSAYGPAAGYDARPDYGPMPSYEPSPSVDLQAAPGPR